MPVVEAVREVLERNALLPFEVRTCELSARVALALVNHFDHLFEIRVPGLRKVD